MSWQQYVDSNLVGTGKVTQAAIYGAQGGLWAASSGFQASHRLQPNEVQAITKAFSDPSDIRANGLHVNNVKYFTLRADDRVIYGKKNATGVVLAKTTQAILIGVYGEGQQAGDANKVVEGLADYLISVGY
ncbi:hypothetical protein BZG36_04377 [Bifiguratus adelaidae]|uniref:Profilin n=1 Tax=Bifiguratus adelaidae TaxID=1938954 RepID=A0A261XVU1_9FUNG|nr:hypothetical protein BZG36_04377 [Bifiguratus adelaidae]